MIIPKTNKKGSFVITKREIDVGYAIITVGHLFRIVGEDIDGLILEDQEQDQEVNSYGEPLYYTHKNIIRGISMDDLEYTDSLNLTKRDMNYYWDELEIAVSRACPYYDIGHTHYNKNANYCNIDEKSVQCVVKTSCLQYLSDEKISNIKKDKNLDKLITKINKDLRKHKIKRLL